MATADDARLLRSSLPAEAFRPNPRAYAKIVLHVAVVIAGWIACRELPYAWLPLVALVIGVSLSAIAFLAHDLSHRSIVTHRALLYPTELLLWALLYFPATLWRKVHTSHHVHLNGEHDPDRRYLADELSPLGKAVALTLYPNREWRYNVICLLYIATYPMRHGLIALLRRDGDRPRLVPARARYAQRDLVRIAGEAVFVLVLQGAIIAFTGTILWSTLLPVVFASSVVSLYFFTNHSLHPLDERHDPIDVTTTIIVPKVFNWLHSHFAYHTEHHMFPAMNSAYLPLVAEQMRRHFPTRYHCIPAGEAWSRLWQNALVTTRRGDEPAAPASAERTPQATQAA